MAGQQDKPDGQRHSQQAGQQAAGSLRPPAVGPAGDASGDAVDEIVEVKGWELIGPPTQVHDVAVV